MEAARFEHFAHLEFSVEIELPISAEELIDTSDFNDDERLPYWAEIWPSARALTRHLLERAAAPGRTIELGSGVALPSLALLARGEAVLATDYYEDALDFARRNAARNRLPPLETLLLDWRTPPPELGRFERVIAADVAYELRNALALAKLIPLITSPGGEVLIADPGRVHLGELLGRLTDGGWSIHELESRSEVSDAGPEAPPATIRILSLSRPS